MPIDPLSGGTWIGVNSAGLVACVMNSSAPVVERDGGMPLMSRGVIVPQLLEASTCLQAAERAQEIDVGQMAPFRVFVLERYRWWMGQSDGRAWYNHDIRGQLEPLMFASSRLGDEVVDPPRRRAFEALLAQGQFTDDVQDAFHSRRDAGGEHLSVMMSRADARTMSRTTIEMTGTASVKYEGFTNEGATESSRMEMEVVRPVQEA